MQFANPIWLWALSGLLIPIGIHLFSRKEGKVIPMGSLRYLRESPTARYKNIRLNEIALLLLRCLLIALLVFLLAGAQIPGPAGQNRKWLLVEPGIENADDIKSVIERLANEGFQLRSLTRGFPLLSDKTIRTPVDSYWSAARQLAGVVLDSVVVISYNYLRNYRGERIAMPSRMNWIPYPTESTGFIAHAFSLDTDSVMIRKGNTSPFATRYETITATARSLPDSVRLIEPEVLEITIFAGEDFAYDEKILRASLVAIQSITPHKLTITTRKIEEAENVGTGIVFWLADQTPAVKGGNLTIAYRPCNGENVSLLIASAQAIPHCEFPKNVSWIISRRLSEERALKEHLTAALARVILPSAADVDTDQRVLPEALMWSSVKKEEVQSAVEEGTEATDLFIIVIFIMVLLTERTVAYKRNQ